MFTVQLAHERLDYIFFPIHSYDLGSWAPVRSPNVVTLFQYCISAKCKIMTPQAIPNVID